MESEAKLVQITQNENHIHRSKHLKVVNQDSKLISSLSLRNFLNDKIENYKIDNWQNFKADRIVCDWVVC